MKKLVILLVMMLVASGVNAQSTVENLFERLENKEKEETAKIVEQKRISEEHEKIKKQEKICRDFANKLRFDGVDITKLTDKDIDQLDTLRRERIMQDKYNSLYSLPSEIFKSVMNKEKRYYARIIKILDNNISFAKDIIESADNLTSISLDGANKYGWKIIYCDADSTVFIEPGYYCFNICELGQNYRYVSRYVSPKIEISIWPTKERIYNGGKIKIGRATFICRESEEKTKEGNIKKTKKRKHYDDVYE